MTTVIRETRELLAALHKLHQAMPNVLVGIWDGSLPPDKQVAFGDLLVDAGDLVREHARTERTTVVESASEAGDTDRCAGKTYVPPSTGLDADGLPPA